ncbi:hypothetical protein L6475_12190 [Prevotella sp. E9-3]|uniref:hypothetical protein n=1 Tax=Prevotella sp. E9-3 TaxID=2913621 RepID=UPI001EDA19D6|nr:hypothetical protein [Prevotella sp. E9-3]UKK47957.1 hypothetical protein L6475_12190 [Prevotella sp. E9-3]
MQVVGHDDIVLNEDHGIVGMDAVQQLMLHHLPYGRQGRAGSIGTAVRCRE